MLVIHLQEEDNIIVAKHCMLVETRLPLARLES